MQSNQTYLKGITLAFVAALISGLAVFMNKFGVDLWTNSSVYTTAKNIVAAIFLVALILLLGKIKELKGLSKSQWLKLLLIAFIGGSVPFLLFFKSLTMISATEAAFIHKTLFIWVALLSYPFLKERLNFIQLAALAILLGAVYISGFPANWSFGWGLILALTATLLWAIENILAKKILSEVSPLTVGWARMFLGSLFLLIWLGLNGNIKDVIPSSFSQGMWAAVVGIILFGYVISWYGALKRAPATIVSSILVLAAPITALLDGVMIQHAFPIRIILPTALAIIGIILILKHAYLYSKFTPRKLEVQSS